MLLLDEHQSGLSARSNLVALSYSVTLREPYQKSKEHIHNIAIHTDGQADDRMLWQLQLRANRLETMPPSAQGVRNPSQARDNHLLAKQR